MTRTIRILAALFAAVCLSANISLKAETPPLWLNAGEAALNAKVSNDTYHIVVLHTWGPSEKALEETCRYSLSKFIKENYGAQEQSITIEQTSGGSQPVFFVNFRTPTSDHANFIVAKLIDSCSRFEDYDVNVFQYEFYQLFAISNLNEYPVYDEFELKATPRAEAAALALVPGLAQITKGQKSKALLIIGGEVGLVGASLIFENKRAYCKRQMNVETWFESSWDSKSNSWRNFRNMALGAAGALYLYNIIDAIVTEGGRKLEVKKVWNSNISFTPWFDQDFSGMVLTINF